MRRQIAAIAAVFFLAGQAFANTTSWSGLPEFAGTYPAAGLMKSSLVRDEIAALLSPAQLASLEAMTESPPISLVGGVLLAQFCMPHDCGSQSAVLVADPVGQNMWVGFYSNNGKRFRMEWVGTDDPANVPQDVQKQLAKIHSPF